LLEKQADVPMSFADACLARMTETLNDPTLLTTDTPTSAFTIDTAGRSFSAFCRAETIWFPERRHPFAE
jgi:hypothetical protein